jgi:hypothetical protein
MTFVTIFAIGGFGFSWGAIFARGLDHTQQQLKQQPPINAHRKQEEHNITAIITPNTTVFPA